MRLETGTVVRSLAGRDKGRFLVVTGYAGNDPLVCDGKERPLERPKRKNPRHIRKTNTILPEERLKTNKKIRFALRDLGFSGEEELECRRPT